MTKITRATPLKMKWPDEMDNTKAKYYLTQEQLNSPKYKLCRFILYYFRKFCMAERNCAKPASQLDNNHKFWTSHNSATREHRVGGDNDNDPKMKRHKAQKRDVWPRVILLFYIIFTMRECIYLYLKFDYDTCTFKLDRWRKVAIKLNSMPNNISESSTKFEDPCLSSHSNQVQATTNKANKFLVSIDEMTVQCNPSVASDYAIKIDQLKGRAEAIRKNLKLIGDPYINEPFIIQPAWFFVHYITLVCYIGSRIVYRRHSNFEYSCVRLILEEADEYELCRATIRSELRRVASSSRNFLCKIIQIASVIESAESSQLPNSVRELQNGAFNRHKLAVPLKASLARYHQAHRKLMRQLARLSESNLLHPINRTSREWIDKLTARFLTWTSVALIYGFWIDLVTVYLGHALSSYELEFETFADRLYVLQFFIYFWIVDITAFYYGILFLIDCTDQTRYCEWIERQVVQLIRDDIRLIDTAASRKSVSTINGQSSGAAAANYDKLNSNLIEFYLRYRIFIGQLNRVKGVWHFVGLIGLSLMILVPFVARIYIPYIANDSANLILLTFVLSMLFFVNLMLAPLCAFEQRGHRLYKSMFGLLAHCIHLQSQLASSSYRGRNVNDNNSNLSTCMEHTIALIRRELDDPVRFIDQFTTRGYGFSATFPSLVKLHFYYSIILLSLFREISSWESLFGSRLKDPLGLLSGALE